MRRPLKLHPMSHSQAVEAIATDVARAAALLTVRYSVTGSLEGLLLPALARPERTDDLWRHTCFEAFVSRSDGGYDEFNFSPSGQWAAYRFDAYREGMRPLDIAPPKVTTASTVGTFELTATFELAAHAERLGLSAVIEEGEGAVSYWALAHAPGKPDFHSPDCFALELAAKQAP